MTSGKEDISISNETARQRYEIAVGGELAGFVEYRLRERTMDLVHTEVLPQFEGRGLAGKVAQFALDDARRQGRRVAPSCSYIARYVERHPQLHDLVEGGAR